MPSHSLWPLLGAVTVITTALLLAKTVEYGGILVGTHGGLNAASGARSKRYRKKDILWMIAALRHVVSTTGQNNACSSPHAA